MPKRESGERARRDDPEGAARGEGGRDWGRRRHHGAEGPGGLRGHERLAGRGGLRGGASESRGEGQGEV